MSAVTSMAVFSAMLPTLLAVDAERQLAASAVMSTMMSAEMSAALSAAMSAMFVAMSAVDVEL